jgi:hypothetical protein
VRPDRRHEVVPVQRQDASAEEEPTAQTSVQRVEEEEEAVESAV